MDAEWIKSPSARRVLEHWTDPRPAWLWRGDGLHLLWANPAAQIFGQRSGAAQSAAQIAAPIKGQVARLNRLGLLGQPGLSRLQFLAAGRPLSATCSCTPLVLGDGTRGLLVVGTDAMTADALKAAPPSALVAEGFFAEGTAYLVCDSDGQVLEGSPSAMRELGPRLDAAALVTLASSQTLIAGVPTRLTRLDGGPNGAEVLVFEPEMVEAKTDLDIEAAPVPMGADDPLLPLGLPDLPPVVETAPEDAPTPDVPSAEERSLSSLFDRLADDAELYRSLEEVPPAEADGTDGAEPVAPSPATEFEAKDVAPPEAADTGEVEITTPDGIAETDDDTQAPALFRVTGRWFDPDVEAEPPDEVAIADITLPETQVADADRVSRYNFDELSRILTDRVNVEEPQAPVAIVPAPPEPSPSASPPTAPTEGGQLVNLGGETLILNRLPLGILVFRDQQVLFANRAITEMIGYHSVEDLRRAGLASIFPGTGDEAQASGPINHLVQRGGTLVPVTARLQSIAWQGRPALMLSASASEVRTGHEAAVRAFAELLADSRHDGFVELTRNGMVAHASALARDALADDNTEILGKPLLALLDPTETKALQAFLERPARFAETTRPAILLKAATPDVDMLVFAQGQAGVVTGYFALVHRRPVGVVAEVTAKGADFDVLARLSRGVRRPLNTIIGFADLIAGSDPEIDDRPRQREYAGDIKTAGLEIAALVDELDDFTRIEDGQYDARPAQLDLGAMLESCVVRVRPQAGAARVLVRSAISERLPRIRADRASLGQAVLNLLASAIGQTPPGGAVILSAQSGDDGTIVVNIRDSGAAITDPDERFVVFRDGLGRDGERLGPVRSSVGLALTRSLLGVNAIGFSVDPLGRSGTLFSLVIPSDAIVSAPVAAAD